MRSFEWQPDNLTETQSRSAERWIYRRLENGLPVGCYGLYRWLADKHNSGHTIIAIAENRRASFKQKYESRKSYNRWRSWKNRNCVEIEYEKYMAMTAADRRNAVKASKLERESLVSKNIEKFKGLGLIHDAI